MDINWLQDFLAVADTRHFTQAANRRNISQAAFSRRIRALENWLGVTLIERGTVPAHLTAEGKRFEGEARDTVARLLDARASLTRFTGESRSTMHVSVTQAIAMARLSDWWAVWCEGSNINLETYISSVSDVVPAFLAGQTDMLICYQSDRQPPLFDSRHYLSFVIESDRLLPVVAADGVFMQTNASKNMSDEALKNVPLLMYTQIEYFSQVVTSMLQQSKIQLLGNLVVETQMADFIANCAARNMGLGWVPESLLRSNYSDTLVVVDEPALSATMDIVAYVSRKRRSYACDQIWQRLVSY